ncbi:MAG: 16S rRNA (guanine(966)-N(2))-methyltransferase RsmD [Pseudomarimonas sp.]
MVTPPSRTPPDKRPAAAARGHVRIIGGRLRGSKLPVAAKAGLRPTSDRVRETLFNWLAADLPGSHCVDLFAGSGALGFEAASRGAARALLVERDLELAASLRGSATRLHAATIEVLSTDALGWLAGATLEAAGTRPFDIAFVDPPFQLGLWNAALAGLVPLMAARANIYVESAAGVAIVMPEGFVLRREGRTRDVEFRLLQRTQAA